MIRPSLSSHDAIGDPRDLAVVRHDDDRPPGLGLRLQQASGSVCPVWKSSSPVGSSARIMGLPVASARRDRDALLLAARELVGIVVDPVGASPTSSSTRRARAAASWRSAISAPKRTFSSAVSSGNRLKAWNTKLTVLRRYSNCCAFDAPVNSAPGTSISPEVGESSAPDQVEQRRLSAPGRSEHDDELAGIDRQRRRLERDDGTGSRLEPLRRLLATRSGPPSSLPVVFARRRSALREDRGLSRSLPRAVRAVPQGRSGM